MHKLPRTAREWLLALGLMLISSASFATTTCTGSVADVNFGEVDAGGYTDVSGSLTVTCSTFGLSVLANVKVEICFGLGDGSGGGGDPRRMANGYADTLDFNFYVDPARQVPLLSPSLGLGEHLLTARLQYDAPVLGGSGSVTLPFYGRIPPQAGLSAGLFQSSFAANHTDLRYRYDEPTLILPSSWPSSCMSGGDGGGALVRTPFEARATVADHCKLAVASTLDFGTHHGAIAEPLDQTSFISMDCTGRTAWQLALDDGQHSSGAVRRMRSADGQFIAYDLYRNAARTERWGHTPFVDTIAGTGTGGQTVHVVHGRVFGDQVVPAARYSDLIQVTVTY